MAAVGADLRIGGDGEVEQVGAGQAAFGRDARAANRRAGHGGGCGRGCGRFRRGRCGRFLREAGVNGKHEQACAQNCQFAHEKPSLFLSDGAGLYLSQRPVNRACEGAAEGFGDVGIIGP